MNSQQIQALAEAIAAAQLQNLWSWILWLALALVAGAVGSFGGAYFGKRGERFATKQDLGNILDELKKTTDVIEQVKSAVAHDDWVRREWKAIRLTKSEEILKELEVACESYRLLGRDYLFFELRLHEDVSAKIKVLAELYFPEALVEVCKFGMLYAQGVNLLLDIRVEMEAEGVPISQSTVRTRRMPEVLQHSDELRICANEVQAVVRKCLWHAFGLPDYPHDPEKALQAMRALTTPRPAQTPSGSSAPPG